MAECVDRDELLHAIGELPLAWEYGQAVSEIYEIVKNAPTINPDDLSPRGRWEKTEYNGFVRCSACRDVYIDESWLEDGKWKFCPNCGARMEETSNAE